MIKPLVLLGVWGGLLCTGCGEVAVDSQGNALEDEGSTGVSAQGDPLHINVVICAGGNAPVRYYNASTCGGTVYDYYPQGWHGWYTSSKQCNQTGGFDYYFHPDNGAASGWIESWRLCGY